MSNTECSKENSLLCSVSLDKYLHYAALTYK